MAEMSAGSAMEIKKYASDLGKEMTQTLENMQRAQEAVKDGIKNVEEASLPLDEFAANTSRITEILEDLTATAEEQTAATEEVAANASAIATATDFATEIGKVGL